jgi:hypothetical protein
MAIELVPETPVKVTSATVQATNDYNTAVNGNMPEMLDGTNHIEYIEKGLKLMAQKVQQAMKSPQKMMNPTDLKAMPIYAQAIAQNIKVVAQDKAEAPKAKQYAAALQKIMAQVKAFGQRMQAAAKKQQAAQAKGNGNGEAMSKIAAPIILAQTKAKIKEAEAQQKLKHKDQQFKQSLRHKAIDKRVDIASKDLETAANIRRGGMSLDE